MSDGDLMKDIARIVDPAPFGRQDKDWNGRNSPLWEYYHHTDVRRITTAMNRAKAVVDLVMHRSQV